MHVYVSRAPPVHFEISAPASTASGSAFSFTITVLDRDGNTATSFADALHFTSSDIQAWLSGDSTLTKGTGTFSAA